MKIYLRHRNGRCIEYMDLEGKWKSTGTHSKYEAQTIAASLICRKNEDSFGNFSEHILYDRGPGSYYDMMKELGRYQDSTMKEFRQAATVYVIPYFSNFKLSEITAPIIQIWYMNLKKKDGTKAAVTTCNHALSALSRILSHAEMLGKIDSNPCKLIKRKRDMRKGHEVFTKDELDSLFPSNLFEMIEIFGSLDNALFYLIMRDTGFRPCEIAAFTTESYHPRFHAVFTSKSCDRSTRKIKDSVKTTGRGYSERTGTISKQTEEVMNIVISLLKPGSYLFTKKSGELTGPEHFNRIFPDILKKANIDKKGRTLYSLRATFFTNILSTYDDKAAMMLMGHTGWNSCYDHRTPEQIVERTIRILESSHIQDRGKPYSDAIVKEG